MVELAMSLPFRPDVDERVIFQPGESCEELNPLALSNATGQAYRRVASH